MLACGSVMLLAMEACTSIHTRTLEQGETQMSQAQFAKQFERVFRYHNRITNQLIMELPSLSLDEEDAEDLTNAEEQMNEACGTLNEVASLEAVSQHADFWTERELPEAVPECEEATQAVDDLFRALGNKSKRKAAGPDSAGDPPSDRLPMDR
jgi:hypothetical protein